MIEYWSWWQSAIALAVVTLGFWLLIGRTLGVSGSWARVVLRKNDKYIEQAEAPFRNNPQLLKDALVAATIDQFGEKIVLARLANHDSSRAQSSQAYAIPKRVTWAVHLTFLVALFFGGMLAAVLSGHYEVQMTLGELHTKFFGTGMSSWTTLFMGGALVGYGTQMGGGCTSGHALSGCPRFVPASLIATGTFFATAVCVSLLMHYF